jgi:hypothetical protein
MKYIYVCFCVQRAGGLNKGDFEGVHWMSSVCFKTKEEADVYCNFHQQDKLTYYWNKVQLGKMDIKKYKGKRKK